MKKDEKDEERSRLVSEHRSKIETMLADGYGFYYPYGYFPESSIRSYSTKFKYNEDTKNLEEDGIVDTEKLVNDAKVDTFKEMIAKYGLGATLETYKMKSGRSPEYVDLSNWTDDINEIYAQFKNKKKALNDKISKLEADRKKSAQEADAKLKADLAELEKLRSLNKINNIKNEKENV